MSDLHVGIFGPGLSGKSTLAHHLSRAYWQNHRIKSLVLDPNGDSWGPQAWTTADEEKFLAMVWAEQNCAVFMEEAAESVNRDSDKTPLFTRLRHRGHKLHVIGHSGASLLPVQREQLHTLFLFRQPKAAAEVWAALFTDDQLLESCNLEKYEFLWARLYQATRRTRLDLSGELQGNSA